MNLLGHNKKKNTCSRGIELHLSYYVPQSFLFTTGKTPQINGILYMLNFLTVVNAVSSSLKCDNPQINKNICLVFGSIYRGYINIFIQ